MNYIAFARKWRPRTFAQLAGQEHIIKALTNSLKLNRIHHAYIFTGTRGVGKTSIARLLAKSINCEQGILSEPCLKCASCIAIENGNHVDLIEVDAASKTGVDDTRELLDNVQYAPTTARFKIYLIDEVHMLSQHSFNALLKTLEEPPEHVKFLLATTDPQKLPATVLSRCLQFNLRHIEAKIIQNYLSHILDQEQISYDSSAMQLLAKAAKGSMRDALSLLDQAVAANNDTLNLENTKTLLGYTQQDYAIHLLQTLAALAPEQMLSICHDIAREGGNFQYVIDELATYLHQISVYQQVTNHDEHASSANLMQFTQAFSAEDLQLLYQIVVQGKKELSLAPTPAIGFEMTLLRMYTFKPSRAKSSPTLAYQANKTDQVKKVEIPKESKPKIPDKTKSTTEPNRVEKSVNSSWSAIVSQLKLTGLAQNAAENTEFVEKSGSTVTLSLNNRHQSVFTSATVKRLESALGIHYNEKITLKLIEKETPLSTPAQQKQVHQKKIHSEANLALEEDPIFQQLKQNFSADVVKQSIASINDDL